MWASLTCLSTLRGLRQSSMDASRFPRTSSAGEAGAARVTHGSDPMTPRDVESGALRPRGMGGSGGGGAASTTASRQTPELSTDVVIISPGDDLGDPPATMAERDRQASASGNKAAIGVIQAVLRSAERIAVNSDIPGVGEAATLVPVLVKLVDDNDGNLTAGDWRERWCRSIIVILERAEVLLGKVRLFHLCSGQDTSTPSPTPVVLVFLRCL